MAYDAYQAQLLRTLGLLTRGLLHELANPLVALVGSAELALTDAEPGSKLHDRIALTHRTGSEIAAIVRALQGFIRLQDEPARTLSLHEEATAAIELVSTVLPTGERSLSVSGDAATTAPPGPIRRQLVELLAEAIQRADPGAAIELAIDGDVVTVTGGGRLRL